MAELHEKEIDFKKYCRMCKHKREKETGEPCNTCLTETVGYGTRKPSKYEKGEGK